MKTYKGQTIRELYRMFLAHNKLILYIRKGVKYTKQGRLYDTPINPKRYPFDQFYLDYGIKGGQMKRVISVAYSYFLSGHTKLYMKGGKRCFNTDDYEYTPQPGKDMWGVERLLWNYGIFKERD